MASAGFPSPAHGPDTAGSDETAVARVVRAIEDDIGAGRRRRGERVIEARLARELGVSRGPVREALRQLATSGLVERHPRRGWAVRKLAKADIVELYAVRAALEAEAASLAATHSASPASRERMSALRAWLVGFEDGPREYVAALEDNDRFHDEIAELSQNSLLSQMLTQLRPLILQIQFRGIIFATRPKESLAEHIVIIDAILEGDAELARSAMHAHIHQSGHVLVGLPTEAFE